MQIEYTVISGLVLCAVEASHTALWVERVQRGVCTRLKATQVSREEGTPGSWWPSVRCHCRLVLLRESSKSPCA